MQEPSLILLAGDHKNLIGRRYNTSIISYKNKSKVILMYTRWYTCKASFWWTLDCYTCMNWMKY